ncbi:lysine permease [Pseudogymnoascus destructans]|uniref:Lysine permease n=1 Tax=Pseudogymnoascus destructans TaxID=655981 RepID=A0A177AAP6_9PEZI|nr:lysine permease [Pseudogymnoascus destructans]OAF58482.1 lysine permease [Pseudogymnoascus destructans]
MILFFFVFTVFFIGLLVPYTNERLISSASDATASPFVIAADLAGVKVLPGIINAVLFVVLSAANSNVYSRSRVRHSDPHSSAYRLGKDEDTGGRDPRRACARRLGPEIFHPCLRTHNLSSGASTVFGWPLNISAVAGFITRASIGTQGFTAFMP